jgi:hypothetical protein
MKVYLNKMLDSLHRINFENVCVFTLYNVTCVFLFARISTLEGIVQGLKDELENLPGPETFQVIDLSP